MDVGVPAAVEFAALDVVTDGYDIADAHRVLVNAVTEEVELDLLGITVEGLEDVLLFAPGVA